MYFVGIDWADQKHDVAILDEEGKAVCPSFIIKKNHVGFEKLLDRLRSISADPHCFRIGIETPHNLLVDFLVELEYAVFALFPGSMKSFRKRYRSSTARDDKFDSFVLADVLRSDRALAEGRHFPWRPVEAGSELVREIAILVRDHHALIQQQVAFSNMLTSTLKMYYPEYLHFFSKVTCRTSLAFLLAYPDFQAAASLNAEQLAAFFNRHHFRNAKMVDKTYGQLHDEHLMVPEVVIRVKELKAVSCVKKLLQIASELREYRQRIMALVNTHPDGQIFLSYPGVSYVTAGHLIALFGDKRHRYADVSELQALTGTCPVTEKSGKGFKVIYYRRACNKFYRDLMHNIAFSSLTKAQWAMAYYKKHRKMNKSHNHSLRCLANRHLRILFSMWKHKTLYDENIFLAQRSRHLMNNEKTA